MSKILFIDSQIWLGLYNSSINGLERFKDLEHISSEKGFRIITTPQIMDEVRRNRYNSIYKDNLVIKNTLLKHKNININIPNFFKEFKDEIKKFNIAERALNDAIKNLNDKAERKASDFELESDKIIKDLLYNIDEKNIYDTNSVYSKAIYRMNIGNPPGKNNSYGDALNWEALLETNADEIFFISSDKDYWDDYKKGIPNSFLLHEWRQKKHGKNLYMYRTIKEFFDNHITDIKAQNTQIIKSTINELKNSPNYVTTHYDIKKLTDYINTFDDEDKIKILTAFMFNSQVKGIINDQDVNEFFKIIFKTEPSENLIKTQLCTLSGEKDMDKIMEKYFFDN